VDARAASAEETRVKEQSLDLPSDVENEFTLRRRGRGVEHDVSGGGETSAYLQ
jgi:hypothetical protein